MMIRFGSSMVRLSPNHGTLWLYNDNDDDWFEWLPTHSLPSSFIVGQFSQCCLPAIHQGYIHYRINMLPVTQFWWTHGT